MEIKLKSEVQNIIKYPQYNNYQHGVIERYNLYLSRKNVSLHTRRSTLQNLKKLILFFDKPIEDLTQEDVDRYLDHILNTYSDRTAIDRRKFLVMILEWYHQKARKDIPILRDVDTRMRKARKLPEDIPTPDEIQRMISVTESARNKCIIILLYESAARSSEFLQLKIKDVDISNDSFGHVNIPRGKTKGRKIPIIFSLPYLREWLNIHPFNDDPNAPLFINQTNKRFSALKGCGLNRVLKEAAKLAGLNKRIHPHIFRHGRLSELAKELTESELQVYAGWNSTNMAQVYVHLSGEDVSNKLLSNAGLIEKGKSDRNSILRVTTCPKCGATNSPDVKYCRCGLILDLKEAQRMIDNVIARDSFQRALQRENEYSTAAA